MGRAVQDDRRRPALVVPGRAPAPRDLGRRGRPERRLARVRDLVLRRPRQQPRRNQREQRLRNHVDASRDRDAGSRLQLRRVTQERALRVRDEHPTRRAEQRVRRNELRRRRQHRLRRDVDVRRSDARHTCGRHLGRRRAGRGADRAGHRRRLRRRRTLPLDRRRPDLGRRSGRGWRDSPTTVARPGRRSSTSPRTRRAVFRSSSPTSAQTSAPPICSISGTAM